jgi:hypothetical protein
MDGRLRRSALHQRLRPCHPRRPHADRILLAIAEGPFAAQSQLWQCQIGSDTFHPVQQGLPPALEGKIDTGQLTTDGTAVALLDGGGNLWYSPSPTAPWQKLTTGLPWTEGLLLL